MLIVTPKSVSLGGTTALDVRRTLPSGARSLVGAWCFVDHYGPTTGAPMDVAPHPHTGLQTVSWLFSGEVEHRDSGGVTALVRPGEVNLMTAGAGVAHSEVSTRATDVLHGVQLWVALPDAWRAQSRGFQQEVAEQVESPGVRARVFVGSLAGASSPIRTDSPLLGVEVVLEAGATWEFAVDPAFEHGVLVDAGPVDVDGVRLGAGALGVQDAGPDHLRLANPTDTSARVLLLGGTPFDEPLVMWWNFVARSHEEIVALRSEWNDDPEGRFGRVDGYGGTPPRLLAPPLPDGIRLRPRYRLGRR